MVPGVRSPFFSFFLIFVFSTGLVQLHFGGLPRSGPAGSLGH